jgi:hypothetical protein
MVFEDKGRLRERVDLNTMLGDRDRDRFGKKVFWF